MSYKLHALTFYFPLCYLLDVPTCWSYPMPSFTCYKHSMQIASTSFWGVRISPNFEESWEVKVSSGRYLEILFDHFYVRCDSGMYAYSKHLIKTLICGLLRLQYFLSIYSLAIKKILNFILKFDFVFVCFA